jgi:carboxyl-terminal processing protease
MVVRTVPLRRRALFLPSVSYSVLPDSAIAYLHVAGFQDTTPKEVDDALARLAEQGTRGLVLDLRGNGGGLFDAAIGVARRFVPAGVLASRRHQDPRHSQVYHARGAARPDLPLVVLIDGDTASAAEVLAGALKETGRATLVGQTSFGKGCTQCVLKLPAMNGVPTGGLRLTVARFYSPKGASFTGRGVVPDISVERIALGEAGVYGFDAQLAAAVAEVERQIMAR